MYSGQCDVTEFVFDCFAVGGATAALRELSSSEKVIYAVVKAARVNIMTLCCCRKAVWCGSCMLLTP